jgi:hypothetical protein
MLTLGSMYAWVTCIVSAFAWWLFLRKQEASPLRIIELALVVMTAMFLTMFLIEGLKILGMLANLL